MHTNGFEVPAKSGVARAAQAFAASLAPDERSRLIQPYSRAAARNWSNFPDGYLAPNGRIGLKTDTLKAAQWAGLEAVLATAMGSGRGLGVDAIRQHLGADDYLHARGAGPHYGRGNFFIAFLGEPTDDDSWQLQFGGHHLAVSNTYRRGRLVGATPSFRGIEPFPSFVWTGRVHTPLTRKHIAMAALLRSLDAQQLRLARLHGQLPDLLLGPGDDDMFPADAEGLTAHALSDAQQTLLMTAIGEWVLDIDDVTATQIMHEYAQQLDRTRVAFAGSPRLDRPGDYARIDGPRVWIEFSMHDGIVLTHPHPHTVGRDRLNDYGGDER